MPTPTDNTAFWSCGEKRSTDNAFSRLSSVNPMSMSKADKAANAVRRLARKTELAVKAAEANTSSTNLMPPTIRSGVYFPPVEGREASQADNDKRQKAKLRRI